MDIFLSLNWILSNEILKVDLVIHQAPNICFTNKILIIEKCSNELAVKHYQLAHAVPIVGI